MVSLMETLEQIVQDLAVRLEAWLDTPNDASRGLEALRSQLQSLGGTIGKKAASDALRALQGSGRDIRRSAQRDAALRLSVMGKSLGIPLVAGTPPKRQRRRTGASAPKLAGAGEPLDQAVIDPAMGEKDPSDDLKPRGFLGRAGGE